MELWAPHARAELLLSPWGLFAFFFVFYFSISHMCHCVLRVTVGVAAWGDRRGAGLAAGFQNV